MILLKTQIEITQLLIECAEDLNKLHPHYCTDIIKDGKELVAYLQHKMYYEKKAV